MTQLFVELDHLVALRRAGGGRDPDPARCAVLAELAGASGISVTSGRGAASLQERDFRILREVVHSAFAVSLPPQEEGAKLALQIRPDLVTLIPEPREPYGPERGLDVEDRRPELSACVASL